MSLILIPQISGSVLPANVHQKTATFHYILSITARTSTSIAPARLGTASIPARTLPSTSDHSQLDRLGVEQRAPRLRRFKLG